MKNILFYALAFTALFLMSCDKDNDPSKKDLLTAHPWREISDRVDGVEQHNSAPCSADDMYIFRASDNGFAFDEGATMCFPTSSQTQELGTWAFSSNETVLVLNFPSLGSSEGTINTLTDNSLGLTFNGVRSNGTTFVQVVTYEKY